MCLPKETLFCVTHPQKVFLAGFILGYLIVKDSHNFRRRERASNSKDETHGLATSFFPPVPYRYPYRENPRDSHELMLNQARLAYDAKHPTIIDQDEEQPTKLVTIHYDYESMRREYQL